MSKQRRYTSEERAEIISRYLAGEPTATLCGSPQTLYKWLREEGIPLRGCDGNPGVRLPADVVERTVALYKETRSAEKVADAVGVCPDTVLRFARTAYVEIVPWRDRTKVDVRTAQGLYEQGYSLAEAAEAVGVSDRHLATKFREAGIPIRGRGRPRKNATNGG